MQRKHNEVFQHPVSNFGLSSLCHASLSGLFPLQLWCSAVGAANRRGTLQRDRWTRCRLWSRCQQAHPAHPFHVPRTFCAAHVRWYTPAEM